MSIQTVRVVTFKDKRSFIPREDTFKFRADLKHHWLQKICFRVLTKLKAFSLEETIEIHQRYINAANFMEMFYKASGEMFYVFDRRPTVLLIGLGDYEELMREVYTSRDRFSFQAEYYLPGSRIGDRPKVMGLTVHVIPWMQGHVLLTNEELQHEIR